ncbi:phage antirepressor KilAC domain-containing protein [Sphingobacterium sp. UT-1RO-CII-1]|uniref:phage antirepressor KilAC domain-containing protein n=1 Tax=Sphingobacterium sp. UT-1RO-CII-1 TaxID=2995225 RepID=UPI00227B2553|nr:phage antirepressor KilAC domain-containing protein [Sphingobacterium sp. UT-1RO-CII-1]MCY4781466.1 phage antirepressor KilAC domain-containing protein [Sphingobacterium sp. UT-1RO-CII-1]
MNQLTNIQQTMSSREIAELTGKNHQHVLRDIQVLNDNYEKLSLSKVGQSTYKADNGQQYRQYELTKMQTIDLMTGYNIELRIKINRRWEELENKDQFQVPSSMSEALRLAANQAEQIEQQQKQLDEQKPKVVFADSVTQAFNSILIRELAVILAQNGIDIGEKRLFEYLRNNGFLIKREGKDKNTPTQKSIELGLFTIAERTFNNSQGSFIAKTTYVTGRGQQYFINKFLTGRSVN